MEQDIKTSAENRRSQTGSDGFLHVISVSGGKDSTAAAIVMVEKDMPIDYAIFADTGMDFPEIRENIDKLDDYLLRERGIHITRLKHPRSFEYLMFDVPIEQPRSIAKRIERGLPLRGYGWPGIRTRWCTGQLKTHLINREINRLKVGQTVRQYVGIAADEAWRCKDLKYPLVEHAITEAQALQMCYDHGFDFGGIYEVYNRCSCYCCPLQRISELRMLRKNHPDLWEKLRVMDERAREQFGPGPLGQFKQRWSVAGLEERFAKEALQDEK